jgi:hypothetical protein
MRPLNDSLSQISSAQKTISNNLTPTGLMSLDSPQRDFKQTLKEKLQKLKDEGKMSPLRANHYDPEIELIGTIEEGLADCTNHDAVNHELSGYLDDNESKRDKFKQFCKRYGVD